MTSTISTNRTRTRSKTRGAITSAIFLVHTISFLLLLLPTLDLADDKTLRQEEERQKQKQVLQLYTDEGGGGGSVGGGESPPLLPSVMSLSLSGSPEESHNNNNKTSSTNNNNNLRRMETHHPNFGTMMMTSSAAGVSVGAGVSVVGSLRPSSSPHAHGHRHAQSASIASHLIPSPDSQSKSPSSQSQLQSKSQPVQQQQILKTPQALPLQSASASASSSSSSSSLSSSSHRQKLNGGDKNEEPLEPLFLPSSSRNVGPYFESNRTKVTLVARAGQTVLLDCAVVLLQGRTVSWLRRMNDNLQLLTVGNTTYSSDSRLGLHFRYPNNWRLGIVNINKRDEGEYQCQLSTHPPLFRVYHLKVIAPAVLILDENGNAIQERHYKTDSSLHLTCKASHLDKLLDNIGWFKGGKPLPGGDSRIKVKSWKNSTNGEASAFLSVLSVRRSDSGNYTCRASPVASNTIAVHVLNGDYPAAVQHNSASSVLVAGSGFGFGSGSCWAGLLVLQVILISPLPLLHMPNNPQCSVV